MVQWTRGRNRRSKCLSIVFGVVFILMTTGGSVFAQQNEIVWSSALEFQYNQFQNVDWSGFKAVGPPDAFPPGGLHKKAFRLNGHAVFGKIVVAFKKPQRASQLIIVENFQPGRISQVKLMDENGYYYIIYQDIPHRMPDDFRTLVLGFPRTDYKIKTVEISLNSIPAPGNPQIDAVGLIDNPDIDVVRQILRGANYNIQQQLTFVSVKEQLGDQINSKYTEIKPLISYDGATLFFSRIFHPDNTIGKRDPQDIYISNLVNGEWTEAENIGPPLNNQYPNGVCSISPDGNALLLINGYEEDGLPSDGVSISTRTAQGWGMPQKIIIDDFENFSKYQDFFLSSDNEVILMAVQRVDGFGEQDLYVSTRKGYNHYSRPVNLGMDINTHKAEFSPFLSKDGQTLYFASEGHGGFGKSDIFYSRRLDDSWVHWSKPRNIGPSINTSSWEAYFSITASGDYAYFVSSESSRQDAENIYRIPLLQDIGETPPKFEIFITGKVLNASTRQPVLADVQLLNLTAEIESTVTCDGKSGHYIHAVNKGRNFQFQVKAPGFITYNEDFEINFYNTEGEITKNIYLTPIQEGQVITLQKLFFEQGTPVLLENSYSSLNKLVEVMQENPKLVIELAGHTDRLGGKEANVDLSLERVKTIKQYLIEKGIDQNNIETIGYGGAHPIAPSNTEENRSKNRRVEVKILKVS